MNNNKKTIEDKIKDKHIPKKTIYKYIQTLQSFVRMKSVISLQKVNINIIKQKHQILFKLH